MTEANNQALEGGQVATDEPIIENEAQAAPETPVEEAVESEGVESTVDDSEATDELNTEAEGQQVDEETKEVFPKKAERAIERRDKKINKLRNQKTELERELEQYRSQRQEVNQANEPTEIEGLSEPQEGEFDDYEEYLLAKGEYKANQKIAEREAQAKLEQSHQSQVQWVNERAQYVDQRAAEAVKAIPELDGLYRENQDIIEGYSNNTKLAFLEAEKPELAFYALANEGKLESLDDLSPMGVAREIALAEIRGEALSKSRPVSKAPAPIKKAKGGATRSRSLDDMSPTELIEHLNKSKRK